MKRKTSKTGGMSVVFVLFSVLVLGVVSCTSQPEAAKPRPGAAQAEPARPLDTQGILRRIADLCGEGKYGEALDLFDTIDPEDAEDAGVKLLKASVYLSAGETDKAEAAAKTVYAASPENTRAMMVLAAVEQTKGKTREQKALLEKILKLDGNHVEALVMMGDLSAAANSFKTAASFYDKALSLESENGNALLGRAWVYRNNQDPKNAEKLLNRAAAAYPQWAAPVHERARLYRASGYPGEALKEIDRAKAMDGGDYWILVDRGGILVDLNRKEEALKEYESAKQLYPDYFLAYVYSAGIKDELGDYDGAEKDYASLVHLNPGYYFGFEGLGMHMMRKGNWNAAKDAFLEAYNRAEQDAVSFGLLAAMNWMRGGKLSDPKLFLEQVLRKAQRESLEWYVLRLYHDLAGDNDIAIRLDREKNGDTKARMLYYLANYYDIRGNKLLADKYFLQVREMERRNVPEWRLNEWALEQRGLALK